MDIYRELILDHYKNPHNFGELEHPDAKVSEDNVSCGDKITMDITVKHHGQGSSLSAYSIDQVKFSGVGCAISQASASLLTDYVTGMSLESVMALKTEDIYSLLGTPLTPARTKCGTLALEVLHKAVLLYIHTTLAGKKPDSV